MKKWKILNDSDKQSQNSSKIKLENNTNHHENKTHRYVPLKRTKDPNLLNNSKNIQSSKQFYLPIFSRYVSQDLNCSVGSAKSKDKNRDKFKTEYNVEEDLELTVKNLQEIQQNFKKNLGGVRLSDRGGSMVLKRKQEDTIISQRQTERKFVNETSFNKQIDQFEKYRKNLFKKQNKQSGGLKNIKESLHVLSNKQIQLKKDIQTQFNNFLRVMRQNGAKICEKVSEGEQKCSKNQAIQKILEQYKSYKPKIDQLESQKQIFLQNLIKMAPV